MSDKKPNPLDGNGRSDIWTPQWFLDQLRAEGWKFGLDACACEESTAADRYFNKEQNWLQQSWEVGANQTTWCNPPFGQCREWIEKAISEAGRPHGPSVLLLLPANVGSSWFAEYASSAASVTIILPRLNYYLPERIEKEKWETTHVSGGRLMAGVAFPSCLWHITPHSVLRDPSIKSMRISWKKYLKPKGAVR